MIGAHLCLIGRRHAATVLLVVVVVFLDLQREAATVRGVYLALVWGGCTSAGFSLDRLDTCIVHPKQTKVECERGSDRASTRRRAGNQIDPVSCSRV